jgi:hypothetical protein
MGMLRFRCVRRSGVSLPVIAQGRTTRGFPRDAMFLLPISILLNWGYLLCQTCAVAMSFTHTDLQGLFTIPALDSFPGTERNGRAREPHR